MALDRAALLAVNLGDIVTVDAPDLGGQVCLRPLTGTEATRLYSAGHVHDAFVAHATAASICDEHGARLFTAEDAPALFSKPYAALAPVIAKALEINRLTAASRADAKKG